VLHFGISEKTATMPTKLNLLRPHLTPLTPEQVLAFVRHPPLPEVLSGEFVDALELDFREELAELATDYLARASKEPRR
jgi:hypothetical protein